MSLAEVDERVGNGDVDAQLEGLRKSYDGLCARYSEVFAAVGMDVPAVFTPTLHETLLARVANMRDANGAMCAEVNASKARIRGLEALAAGLAEFASLYADELPEDLAALAAEVVGTGAVG